MRLERIPIRRVKRHIADQCLAIDQCLTHGFQFLQHRFPFFVNVILRVGATQTDSQCRSSGRCPARFAELRAQAVIHKAMSAWHESGFQARLFLQHDLLETFPIVELCGEQDILENVQQFSGLTAWWPCRAGTALPRSPSTRELLSLTAAALNSARAFSDPLGEFDIIFRVGSHLEQGAREDLCQRHQFFWQGMQVKAEIEIDDAIREQVMIQNFCVLESQGLSIGMVLFLLFQIFEFEEGHGFQGFG